MLRTGHSGGADADRAGTCAAKRQRQREGESVPENSGWQTATRPGVPPRPRRAPCALTAPGSASIEEPSGHHHAKIRSDRVQRWTRAAVAYAAEGLEEQPEIQHNTTGLKPSGHHDQPGDRRQGGLSLRYGSTTCPTLRRPSPATIHPTMPRSHWGCLAGPRPDEA